MNDEDIDWFFESDMEDLAWLFNDEDDDYEFNNN